MSIQHPRVTIAADKGYLRNGDALIKKARDSLMPQVVEAQVFEACPPHESIPSLSDCSGR